MEYGLVTFYSLRRRQTFADADVAVTGCRLRWFDANRNDRLATTREIKSIAEHLLKFLFFRNDVVRRQDRHDTRRRTRADQSRAKGHCGAGVASDRLGDH